MGLFFLHESLGQLESFADYDGMLVRAYINGTSMYVRLLLGDNSNEIKLYDEEDDISVPRKMAHVLLWQHQRAFQKPGFM